jgi:hypothetical protein
MKVELGVVEDRNDPKEMGRVRVRILGKHTPDKLDIPTDSLPWATVMLPTTSPSTSGLGHTPFLVEGSWVVVAFHDDFMQDPIILGSIGAMPNEHGGDTDTSKGFNDPFGQYPFIADEPDYNQLGRGKNAENHIALLQRQATQFYDIPKATKPDINTVEAVPADERSTWDEPEPKSGTYAQYPFNHVYESESGHVHEIDDSPDGERLMTFHKSGTFEEIHPTGDRVVKIVKDSYEIVLGAKSVYIMGACDITIDGTVRQLIKGDYILEVEGNYTQKIHKNRYTKIGARGTDEGGGNDAFEIIGNRTGNISKGEILRIGEDSNITTSANHIHTINGNWDQTVLKNTNITTSENFNITAHGTFGTFSGKASSMKAVEGMQLNSNGLLYLEGTGANVQIKSPGDIAIESDNITMNTGTNLAIEVGNNMTANAGSDISMTAPSGTIKLN